MLLGLALDAWSGADVKLPVARVQLAERLGYDSVWTAEAYGADALTPLAYLAASTEPHQARDRRRADLGPHPGRDRDGVRHARIARRDRAA